MPKGRSYGSKDFGSLTEAYNRYQRDRIAQTANPALAPRKKFGQIWGWLGTGTSKAVARPK